MNTKTLEEILHRYHPEYKRNQALENAKRTAVRIFWEKENEVKNLEGVLNEREIFVLSERYSGKTLEDIGKQLRVCRARVGQIQNAAIRKLKVAAFRAGKIRDLDVEPIIPRNKTLASKEVKA